MRHIIENSRFLEISSDLADRVVDAVFGENATTQGEDGTFYYTEEAQDLFNEEYDQVQTILNNAGIYSSDQIDELEE